MGITANVKNEQIVASVGESKIDVAVSGGFGPTGAAGAAGQAATITVGTVTTGGAGSQATVTNVGTNSAAVLNFTIPAGATGPQGPAGGDYTLPVATASVLGGVKIGSGISIDGSGVISASSGYTLPTATNTVLGGVKVGSGVTIADGVISVSTNYAAASHTHDFTAVTDATTYTNFSPEGGSLAVALQGIDGAISGKAAATHTHATSEIKTAANKALSTFDNVVNRYATDGYIQCNGLQCGTIYSGADDTVDIAKVFSITFADASAQTTAYTGKIGTTSGLVLKTGTDGVIESLAQGTAGQVLVVSAGATSMEWKTLSASDIGAAALSHAHSVGDLSLTATDVIVGRSSAGAGVGQEITCTAAGRAILDDATAADQRTTLGLGTAATSNTGDFAAASHNQAWSTITSTPTTRSGYGITDAQKTITSGTAAPTGGSDGDIYLQY